MKKFTFSAIVMMASCWVISVRGAEDLDSAWQKYQAMFPSEIQTKAEYGRRKSNFAKTHALIEEHNSNKDATFKMEHNKLSVMDTDELRQFLNSPESPSTFKSFDSNSSRYLTWTDDESELRQLPSTVDLRPHYCMQPVKNQLCGSCWAFAATAVVEFGKCIRTGRKVALSEQHIVDCSKVDGCNGGWYYDAWQYLANTGGQATAASYPNVPNSGTCRASTAIKAARLSVTIPFIKISPGNSYTMMKLLASNRLIGAAFDVVTSFFSYKSGVYSDPDCRVASPNFKGGHEVTLVGFGTLNGMDYWVMRNSWGAGWGAAGYVLFQRGVNMCQIENYAHTANVVG